MLDTQATPRAARCHEQTHLQTCTHKSRTSNSSQHPEEPSAARSNKRVFEQEHIIRPPSTTRPCSPTQLPASRTDVQVHLLQKATAGKGRVQGTFPKGVSPLRLNRGPALQPYCALYVASDNALLCPTLLSSQDQPKVAVPLCPQRLSPGGSHTHTLADIHTPPQDCTQGTLETQPTGCISR